MITEVQNEKIIHYLLEKNLPIDILSEVHDHMISQINDVMFNGLNFEEAFEEVKKSWAKDLDVKSSSIYDKVTPPLVKKIYWAKIKPIVLQSLCFGLIATLLLSIILYTNPQLITENIAFTLLMGVFLNAFWEIYRKNGPNKLYNKYIKKHEKNKLSIYSDLYTNRFLSASLVFNLSLLINLNFDIDTKGKLILFLFILLSFFLVVSVVRFHYLIEKKMVDDIENKSKPYFKYLYANPNE